MSFLLNNIPSDPVVDRFIDLSFEFSERIIRLLKEKGMTQRDLAKKMGKKDSEISKWLRGNHNLTFRTIASLEVALQEKVLQIQGLEENRAYSESLDATIVFSKKNLHGLHASSRNEMNNVSVRKEDTFTMDMIV